MSAEASLTFYGIKYKIGIEELQDLEIRKHPIVQKARAHGLTFFFENLGGAGPADFCLYIGANLGVTGPENYFESEMLGQDVRDLLSKVDLKLRDAGFTAQPKLFLQWIPDS